MARVAQEAAAVGEHADREAHRVEIGAGLELPLDAVDGVVEPPGGAELHLALGAAVAEARGEDGPGLDLRTVQRIEDGLGQFLNGGEGVQEPADTDNGGGVVAAVKACGLADAGNTGSVGVKIGADVKLHDKAVAFIDAGHVEEEGAAVLVLLGLRCGLALPCLLEDRLYLVLRPVGPGKEGNAVVTDGGAGGFLEIAQAFLQRCQQIGKGADRLFGRGGKLAYIPRG